MLSVHIKPKEFQKFQKLLYDKVGIELKENKTALMESRLQRRIRHFNLKNFMDYYTIVNSDRNRPLVNEIVSALKLGERFPIPIMALYKDGKLITHYVGEVQEEFVESDIKRALGI